MKRLFLSFIIGVLGIGILISEVWAGDFTIGGTGEDITVSADSLKGDVIWSGVQTFLDTVKAKVGRTAALVMAASNSSQLAKAQADYVCDGTADNVEIQVAIDSVSAAGGGRIFFLAGLYDISATPLIPSGAYIEIEGEGRYSTTLKLSNSVAVSAFPDGSVLATSAGATFTRIANIGFDGNKSNQADSGIDGAQCGIYTSTGTYLVMENLYIRNATREGIYVHEYSSHLSNVHVSGCGRAGIEIDANRYTTLINCRSYSNGSISNPAIGIDIVGGGSPFTASQTKVIGCQTYQNFGQGFAARNAADVVFSECHSLEDGTNAGAEYAEYQRSGILIQNSRRIKVVNSVFKYSTWGGIHLDTADHCIISNNHCIGNGSVAKAASSTGIYASGTYNKYTGNICYDDQDPVEQAYGYYDAGGAGNNYNTVENNDFRGSTEAVFINPGSNLSSRFRNNQGSKLNQEKEMYYVKNTSTANLVAGNVVVLKAVAAGNEVTTTVIQGNGLVLGMLMEDTDNLTWGYVQTLGKTTLLKVNGTTDIAIGDFLGTSTGAGIAMKITRGMAFAIALEVYTTDDANGVIDALIIEPRRIDFDYSTLADNDGITLTTSDFGKTITVNSGSTQTVVLPSVDATNIGARFTIVKLGAGQVTIDAPDSDLIADSSAGGTIYNNVAAETYATITIQLATATQWIIISAHGTWTTT